MGVCTAARWKFTELRQHTLRCIIPSPHSHRIPASRAAASSLVQSADNAMFYTVRDDRFVKADLSSNSPTVRARCMIKFESRRSAVINVIGDSITRIRAMARAKKSPAPEHRSKVSTSPTELGLDDAIYRPPQSPDWETAWNVTEKLLLAVSEDVKEHGAQFLVVTASVGPQVYPNPLWRAKVREEPAVGDLFIKVDNGRWERGGSPVLNLAPAVPVIRR